MKKRKKKPGVAMRVAKFAVGGVFNLTEDMLVEAINTVPGHPKIESYGQYCRRTKNKRRA